MSLRATAGLLALFVSAACAQVVSTGPPPSGQGSITMGTRTAFMGTPVTGAPYSAEEVIEHAQTLADGTHIAQKPRTRLMVRDSQGRTRTERSMFFGNGDQGARTITEIKDPVAGVQYTLDPQTRIAHRVALTKPGGMAAGTGVVIAIPAISMSPVPSSPPPPQRAEVSSGNGQQIDRIESSSESLGTQTMEGVSVEGRRTTTTIPVGMEGNDRPIVSTHESWWSPELKLVVFMKNLDPRDGENITRLTNITVGDPDPALFQPPADYTIVDEKGAFTIHYGSPALH